MSTQGARISRRGAPREAACRPPRRRRSSSFWADVLVPPGGHCQRIDPRSGAGAGRLPSERPTIPASRAVIGETSPPVGPRLDLAQPVDRAQPPATAGRAEHLGHVGVLSTHGGHRSRGTTARRGDTRLAAKASPAAPKHVRRAAPPRGRRDRTLGRAFAPRKATRPLRGNGEKNSVEELRLAPRGRREGPPSKGAFGGRRAGGPEHGGRVKRETPQAGTTTGPDGRDLGKNREGPSRNLLFPGPPRRPTRGRFPRRGKTCPDERGFQASRGPMSRGENVGKGGMRKASRGRGARAGPGHLHEGTRGS